MYSNEISHVLMHFGRMRTEVEAVLQAAAPRSKKARTCKKFLCELEKARDTTMELWANTGELGYR